MRELLQQVRVLDPVSQSDRVADVLIENGVVREIVDRITDLPDDTIRHDCHGLILGTGLVDLYSHSGEPGFEERETLRSLRHAAAAGGFTRVAVLPDTVPPLDNPASIAWFLEKVRGERTEGRGRRAEGGKQQDETTSSSLIPHPSSFILLPYAALTIEGQGQQMTELAELAATAAVGFADGKPIPNLSLLRQILEYLHPIAKPILLWAWNSDLAGNGVMREGQDSIVFGLPGVPAIAETAAIAAVLECVEATGTAVHLMRISTARGVQLVQAAKARGLPITASTTWLHLLLNTEAIAGYDPNLRLNPPLGTPIDQQALIQAVQAGVIDAIAIDHSPYTYEEKTVAFAEAPSGAIGLELALPLLWQAFIETNRWSALQLWSALSTQPAGCLGQLPPAIALGQTAEMILFDPTHAWTVEPRLLKSLSANTPWLRREIRGQVTKIWC